MLETVLVGSLIVLKHTLPGMKRHGWGRIVNMSSSVAMNGRAGASHYAAAKAGLMGWTKTVAKEVARDGVFINCVVPGLVETERAKLDLREDYRNDMAARNPTGRNGQPNDVANVVAFLVSQANTFMNGALVPVDGGLF